MSYMCSIRLVTLSALCALLVFSLAPSVVYSEADPLCFSETGYCIDGRVRDFWLANGGLAVFGLPLTPVQVEHIEGQPRTVQWFERSRIELHPELPAPYDLQLGRVGAEAQVFAALNGPSATEAPRGVTCAQFAETGHVVCDAFLAAWHRQGRDLDGDGAISVAESLALFGVALGPAQFATLSNGQTYLVQWFERARFELHPGEDGAPVVRFGRVGSELGPLPSAPAPIDEPPAALIPTDELPPPFITGPAPQRMVIWSIGLNRPLVPVGVDQRGDFIVPDLDVGWYNASAAPGQGENIVLWGHVLPFAYAPHLPAPFARLRELPIGARITLYDASGAPHEYAVSQQLIVEPNDVAYVFRQGRELLTLVSCIGEAVVQNGATVDMSHRLITIAEPVGSP
jgi:sortase (surface protein transpeptidase)